MGPSTYPELSTSQPKLPAAIAIQCAVLGIVALGIALRLNHYFAAPSFWYDEAAVIMNVVERGYFDLVGPLENQQAAPPLYLWMLRSSYKVFGDSEWSMRFPAVLGGIGMLILLWSWGKLHLGPAGLICLLAMSATSLHSILHADEVKPYSLDAFYTVLILYVGYHGLQVDSSKWWLTGLVSLAALGPWASFPSVFALCGVGVAWLAVAYRGRERRIAVGLLAYVIMGATSCFLFWHLCGRHQHTRFMTTWWQNAFWDFSSPLTTFSWPFYCLFNLANYSTTCLGVPFLLSIPICLAVLSRRNWITAMMICGLIGSAFLANAIQKYPLDGRVGLFFGPIVWLITATAIDAIYERSRPGWGWLTVVLVLGLLSSDIIRTYRSSVRVVTVGDFHGAFDYVHQHWQSGDSIGMCAHDVYRIYYGKDRHT